MKQLIITVAAGLAGVAMAVAADGPAASPAQTNAVPAADSSTKKIGLYRELAALIGEMNVLISAGKGNPEGLKEHMARLDALLTKYPDEADQLKTLDAKYRLNLEVFQSPEGALLVLKEIKSRYPESRQGKETETLIPTLEKRIAAAKEAPSKETQQTPEASDSLKRLRGELRELLVEMNEAIRAGKQGEEGLKDYLAKFGPLKQKYPGKEEQATILQLESHLYINTFRNTEKGIGILKTLVAGYGETEEGKLAAELIPSLERRLGFDQIREKLVPGTMFPGFDVKDIMDAPISLEKYKGKVVLVDFWATWCPGCIQELPFLKAAYHLYKSKGLEIVGISLDEDTEALEGFLRHERLQWAQIAGKPTGLVDKYGIVAIPWNFLLDRNGKILGANLHGRELAEAMEKALGID